MKPYEESSIFPVGGENTAFAQYFDGTSYLNMLSLEQVVVGNVTFEPGCRNHWHIHKASEGGGQILLAQGLVDSSFEYHLQSAKKNGVTKTEIVEIITHAAFYAGWPKAWAAFKMAKNVWNDEE